MPDEDSDVNGKTGFLKSVVSAFGLVTAWIFVVGWSYLHAYYVYFGLNIDSLDFPVYHFFVFCYTQFVGFSWSGVGIAVVLFAFFLITWAGTQTTRNGRAVLISCAYLIMFWAGFHLAVRNGKTAAIHDMGLHSPLPLISLELPKGKVEEIHDAATLDALGSSDLRLLLETKDRLFVFEPVDTTGQSVRVRVLAVDRQQTPLSMRIMTVR